MLLGFSSRSVWLAALALGLGALHCASEEGARSAAGGSGGAGGDRPRDQFDLDLGGGGTGGMESSALHPLCQSDSDVSCMPDDPDSCPSLGAAGSPGEGGMGGQQISGSAGALGAGGVAPSGSQACHLVQEGDEVIHSCQPAGEGELGAPCLSPVNCAPGYTCVGEGESGLCRPYCCLGDNTSCGTGTYCAPRRVVGSSEDLEAPVCVRADQCKLSEEYPCPEGTSCQCAEDTACVPVRADGTTSCVVPGDGTKGDACEGPFSCSYGHVCSLSRGCLELCSTVSTQSQCASNEFCQALAGFPDDVGVCIALDPEP